MDFKGREESISTNGVARSSPESHRPEMAIMANNGGKKNDFLPKVLQGSKNTKKKAYGSDTNEGKRWVYNVRIYHRVSNMFPLRFCE